MPDSLHAAGAPHQSILTSSAHRVCRRRSAACRRQHDTRACNSTAQLVADPDAWWLQEDPALLLNRGNDYLHYEDDWYIVGSKPDVYQFIYYKGNNDAWKGCGLCILGSSIL